MHDRAAWCSPAELQQRGHSTPPEQPVKIPGSLNGGGVGGEQVALGGGGAAVRGDAVAVLLGGADGVPARERHQMHGRGEQGPC